MKSNPLAFALLAVVALTLSFTCSAEADAPFVHPGGLHTTVDLNRMKAKVAAGEHPWIDSWNALIAHPKAQSSYRPGPYPDMAVNRQRASADAVAAYLNAVRWYISGDAQYAECAVKICNEWSSRVNTGSGGGGLVGIPIYEFAVAAEVLRVYPGWASEDFARFKNMMETYLYPCCHEFLTRHNNTSIHYCWANWDLCNMDAILAIGVLCDDRAKYDEAIEYFKHGEGNGSIKNAVPYIYPGGLGQWQETGRDQEHAQLGVGMMGTFCQIAWNQGDDMYGYDDNRFLAAAEYTAAYNMWKPVPYTVYNNEVNVNNYWPSEFTTWGRGRLQRPIWELIYNHYAVLKGLPAPNVKAMAEIYRPEGIEHDDNFGFGTLLYTLDAKASPYPPSAVPAAPKALTATAGVGHVWVNWAPTVLANGYSIKRSATKGGPYTELANVTDLCPLYDDTTTTNGTTYFYVVAARNQKGNSKDSVEVSAMPSDAGPLPVGWSHADIGSCAQSGDASYAAVAGGTFVVRGSGVGIGGKTDGFSFVAKQVSGDFTITARRCQDDFTGSRWQRIGLMVRESLDPGSKFLMMASGEVGAREAKFGYRDTNDGDTKWQLGNAYTRTPTWFRLTRAGNIFTAYQSTDGDHWFAVGQPVTVDMARDCPAGFEVTSAGGKTNKAVFDHLAIISAKP